MTEADWENLAVETLIELDWPHLDGKAAAPGTGERTSWDDLVIPDRLQKALRALNPTVPTQYLLQAMAEILSPQSQDPITENRRLAKYTNGLLTSAEVIAEMVAMAQDISAEAARGGRRSPRR